MNHFVMDLSLWLFLSVKINFCLSPKRFTSKSFLFAAIIFLAAILLTMFPVPLQKVKLWLRKDGQLQGPSELNDYAMFDGEIVPCTQISVQKTWSKAFSKLSSESPVRKCDVNQDGVEDIIIGYGIGVLFIT